MIGVIEIIAMEETQEIIPFIFYTNVSTETPDSDLVKPFLELTDGVLTYSVFIFLLL